MGAQLTAPWHVLVHPQMFGRKPHHRTGCHCTLTTGNLLCMREIVLKEGCVHYHSHEAITRLFFWSLKDKSAIDHTVQGSASTLLSVDSNFNTYGMINQYSCCKYVLPVTSVTHCHITAWDGPQVLNTLRFQPTHIGAACCVWFSVDLPVTFSCNRIQAHPLGWPPWPSCHSHTSPAPRGCRLESQPLPQLQRTKRAQRPPHECLNPK